MSYIERGKERRVKMNLVYNTPYIYMWDRTILYCGHMTKFSSWGGCFSHTVQNDRNALPKRKSFVWTFVRVCAYVCICKWVSVCVNVYIGNVDAEQLYIAVIYLHPYTKLFSGSPIVGRPQGCTFHRELYKCNGSNFCVDSTTHTFYCPSAI